MDEPFGALDAQTREEMQHLLLTIWKDYPCQIVFVTHDVDEALLMGDRVIIFSTQPAMIADDFNITTARPRSAAWLRFPEIVDLKERVLNKLEIKSWSPIETIESMES